MCRIKPIICTLSMFGVLYLLTGCSSSTYVPPAKSSMSPSQLLHIRNHNGPDLIESIGGAKTFSVWSDAVKDIYLVEGRYAITMWVGEEISKWRNYGERVGYNKVVVSPGWDAQVEYSSKRGHICVSSSDIGRSISSTQARRMVAWEK